MLVFFGILILIASILLGIVILVQNPKGGGVAGSLGGFSNQLIGVKQTTDVLEKGTWILGAIVAILVVVSPAFTPKNGSTNAVNDDLLKKAPASAPAPKAATPTNAAPMPAAPAGGQAPKPQ